MVKKELSLIGPTLKNKIKHVYTAFPLPPKKLKFKKFPEDEDKESTLHVTAFRIPVRHTLYLPAGVIHSNDYLKGTW